MSKEKKIIPKFSTPTEQTREIDGQIVTVRRLPARRSPSVLGRLLGDVGPVITEMMSSPDQELDPSIEGFIRGAVAEKAGAIVGVNMAVSLVKAIVFSQAIAKTKEFDFAWYVDQMLPGCMDVGGVDIETIEELDETGVGPRTMWELFRFACEVNFFPTFAGRDTGDGLRSPIQTPTQPAAASAVISGRSSLRGEAKRDGRRGQTSEVTEAGR